MANPDILPERLASALAARLIHDAMGPASGIVSAFDLIADPAAAGMRDEALALAASSARAMVALLKVSRVVIAGEAVAAVDALALARGLFDGTRATLRLDVDRAAANSESNRVLLGLVQIGGIVASAGGEVIGRASRVGDRVSIVVETRTTRPRLTDDLLAGLAGKPPPEGLAPRWASAYFLNAVVEAAGGEIAVHLFEGGVAFRADIRAETA